MQKWKYAFMVFVRAVPTAEKSDTWERWCEAEGDTWVASNIIDRLNEWGELGWELVNVMPDVDGEFRTHAGYIKTGEMRLFFKRPMD